MTQKEEKIVEAAISVILRYGMRRSSMNDIAKEAGISRQTLYLMFSNKDEVLRATIHLFADRALAEIETSCTNATTLSDKMDIVFEQLAIKPYELMKMSPDAQDIINGFNDACKEEISLTNERYRSAIEEILTPYKSQFSASGMKLYQLADYIQCSIHSFKKEAKTKQHLLELLSSLKILVLKLVDADKLVKD